jgi:hypothetical protein
MPRAMTSGVATALCAPIVRMALLSSMQFATETVYVWTGTYPLTWDSMTFIGVGDMANVDGISEDSNVEAKGVTVSLSGIPSARISDVLFETRVLYNASIWLALFDANGAIIPDPILTYQGKMDAPATQDDATTCTCTISLENILVDLNRACYRRYTDQDQQMDLADTLALLGLSSGTVDTGFSHVAGLQEQITFWGRSPSSVNNV